DAAADDVVVQRDVPEPALAVAGLDDERGPLVAAGVAVRALPVGPDRALVEDRVPHPQAEPVHQQAVLAAGVDDDLRAHLARGVALPDPDAAGAAVLEQHVVDADPLARIDAVLARVLQHHRVELAAHDLPRLRALVGLV